jgi:alkaline phosphatase
MVVADMGERRKVAVARIVLASVAGVGIALGVLVATAERAPRRGSGDAAAERGVADGGTAARDGGRAAPGDAGGDAAAARSAVLLIGDGLGLGGVSTASTALHGPGGGLAVESAPVVGLVRTFAANSLVTDSAAGATAMSTGHRTARGRVGVDVDGRPLENLLERAQERGLRTGVVTTTRIMDATPAGFVAHGADRDQHAELLAQMLEARCDVLAGGHGGLLDEPRIRKALEAPRARGVAIVQTATELAAARGPFYALFAPPTAGAPDPRPPFPIVVSKALDVLSAAPGPRGFVLVAEVEDTDSAGHENDLDAFLAAVRQLDAALREILAFAERHPDTLVVATADHETGSPGVIGGTPDEPTVQWLAKTHTATWVPLFAFGPGAERFGGVIDNTDIPARIADALGLEGERRASPAERR